MTERGAADDLDDDHGAPLAGSAAGRGPDQSGKYSRRLPGTGSAAPDKAAAAAGTPAAKPARARSLQREWSWAFTLMFLVVLLGAGATVIGVQSVMNEVRGAASRLHTEADTVAGLRAALDAHEQLALRLLSGEQPDLPSYGQRQHELSELFDTASTVLPVEKLMREDVLEARRIWQENLAAHGLRADQLLESGGNRLAEAPAFAAAGTAIRARLDAIERSSLQSLDTGIASSTKLEQVVIALRTIVFCVGAAAVLHFRRRMIKYLMRPLESLHRGVAKLHDGDYLHRVEVVRRDELGDLAEAFNSLAAAVHDSYEELNHRATHDPLTGLANRAALTESLAAAFGPGSDRKARHAGLLFIDVDDFKDVNDSLGHGSGDALLIQLAARLKNCVRPDDLVARLGGDEFAIVLMNGEDNHGTSAAAARIRQALRVPFDLGGGSLAVTVSMGGTQRRHGRADPSMLLREADFAMYMAKRGGKDRYQHFDAEGYDHVSYRAELNADSAAMPLG